MIRPYLTDTLQAFSATSLKKIKFYYDIDGHYQIFVYSSWSTKIAT